MRRLFTPPTMEWDIYTQEGVDEFADGDEISAAEEGFMKGYLEEDY